METAALFMNAKKHNKQAVCILTVSDSFVKKDDFIIPEKRQNTFSEAILLALNVADTYLMNLKKKQKKNDVK